jgi:lipoate---protein ligase
MSAPPIRLIDLGPAPFWQTQAVYHAVAGLMHAGTPDTIILTSPRTPYLCLGYHDVYDAVLDRAAVVQRGLPVLRRRVGGGTTYLDADQVFYQCVFHHRRVPAVFDAVYAYMLAAPLAALRRLGLEARLRDTVELEVAGRRIAGVGGGRIGEAAVVVGNLLLDFDYQTMAQVWRAPWPSFRELAAAALYDHVTTLRRMLDPISIETIQRLLSEEFARALGRPLQRGALTRSEVRAARKLGARMAAPAYLDLHTDRAGAARPLKIAGGVCIHAVEVELAGRVVHASLRVCDEMIVDARLESAPPLDWRAVEIALHGSPFADWQRPIVNLLTEGEGTFTQGHYLYP